MNKKIRVGIFGGTFNPPHIGHVASAERFSEVIEPDLLLIIPDCIPPHKEYSGSVTTEERFEMCRLAFGHINNVEISDIEIKRGGRSYTAVTLEELSSPERELFFLCGTDMFLTLEHWYHPEKIFEYSTICYIRRESDTENDALLKERTEFYIKKFNARIIPISAEAIEISSGELREALLAGDADEKFLPPLVKKYILEKGLYG